MTVSSPVVASLHGIGQATVVKVAKKGCLKCGTVPPNAGRLTPMISESNVRHDYAICLGFSIQSQLFIH